MEKGKNLTPFNKDSESNDNNKLSSGISNVNAPHALTISENQISHVDTGGGAFQVGYFHAPTPSKIEALINAAKAFAADSEEYRDLLDELNNYQKPRVGREIIGLKNKLQRANMGSLIDDATYLKNNAITKVARYQLQSHKAAVHNYIYGKINEIFNAQIAPLIREGLQAHDINQFISQMIIQPLADEICIADPTINSDTIRGMLYILTGNCHLTWT
jgi:hypothetical protein